MCHTFMQSFRFLHIRKSPTSTVSQGKLTQPDRLQDDISVNGKAVFNFSNHFQPTGDSSDSLYKGYSSSQIILALNELWSQIKSYESFWAKWDIIHMWREKKCKLNRWINNWYLDSYLADKIFWTVLRYLWSYAWSETFTTYESFQWTQGVHFSTTRVFFQAAVCFWHI